MSPERVSSSFIRVLLFSFLQQTAGKLPPLFPCSYFFIKNLIHCQSINAQMLKTFGLSLSEFRICSFSLIYTLVSKQKPKNPKRKKRRQTLVAIIIIAQWIPLNTNCFKSHLGQIKGRRRRELWIETLDG